MAPFDYPHLFFNWVCLSWSHLSCLDLKVWHDFQWSCKSIHLFSYIKHCCPPYCFDVLLDLHHGVVYELVNHEINFLFILNLDSQIWPSVVDISWFKMEKKRAQTYRLQWSNEMSTEWNQIAFIQSPNAGQIKSFTSGFFHCTFHQRMLSHYKRVWFSRADRVLGRILGSSWT